MTPRRIQIAAALFAGAVSVMVLCMVFFYRPH